VAAMLPLPPPLAAFKSLLRFFSRPEKWLKDLWIKPWQIKIKPVVVLYKVPNSPRHLMRQVSKLPWSVVLSPVPSLVRILIHP
jgi:hypothetical protein